MPERICNDAVMWVAVAVDQKQLEEAAEVGDKEGCEEDRRAAEGSW